MNKSVAAITEISHNDESNNADEFYDSNNPFCLLSQSMVEDNHDNIGVNIEYAFNESIDNEWDCRTVTSEEIDNAEWLPGDMYPVFVMEDLLGEEEYKAFRKRYNDKSIKTLSVCSDTNSKLVADFNTDQDEPMSCHLTKDESKYVDESLLSSCITSDNAEVCSSSESVTGNFTSISGVDDDDDTYAAADLNRICMPKRIREPICNLSFVEKESKIARVDYNTQTLQKSKATEKQLAEENQT